MPLLRLALKDHHPSLGIGDSWHSGWRLGFGLATMGLDGSVRLSNGHELADLPGSLLLRGGEAEARDDKAIGALQFLEAQDGSADGAVAPAPDTYAIEIVMPEDRLLSLIDMVQRGQGPTGVSVSVPDLKYGAAADGSGKQWELSEARSWLGVDGVTFWFNGQGAPPAVNVAAGEVASPSGGRLERLFPWAVGLLVLAVLGVLAS